MNFKHKDHKVHKGFLLGVLGALCVLIPPAAAQEMDVELLRTLTGHSDACLKS